MAKADNIEKQIKKIEKSEEKNIKILNKQHKALTKALDDNERLIEQKLDKGTPAELKLEAEIEKLEKVPISHKTLQEFIIVEYDLIRLN